jgi:signal transduction histidine kinase
VVDIHEGLESTLLILQNQLHPDPSQPGIQVQRDYGDFPPVECYPGALNQVFMYLLTNAIDALTNIERDDASEEAVEEATPMTDWVPTIVVRSRQCDDNTIQISIADNGPGMDEDVQQHMFDFFFSTKRNDRATGLGLSISYQIITENHQGQLICQSTLNKGTEFIVQIPIRQP